MNNLPKIVAIVGMPGAGKSIAADFFKKRGIPVLRFGDQTDIGLKELGKVRSPQNEQWYRRKIREELGMAAMAIKMEPRIKKIYSEHPLIILDGLYSWEEYLYLRERFPQLKLLCVYAKSETRHARLEKRTIRPLTKKQAQDRDIHELEQTNKGGPIAMADYIIINESTIENFITHLETLHQEFSQP
ncbi:TPA: dephospho-CoA kinase [Patescibacteria group bacterium]|uniref:Dephospho-CoA kinase-like protein n=1 Tax=Candidatus Gottesmanbacteria bacterium GW2011_GWA1_43_11 TaxID=1618436 RepID=A0A0G1CGP3_9BACT|nr:MAG: hypothetical protein UV59_C0016G0012 [Candidatus Gottesmanbacteria bacterium GW2011_GWA1_43_11]HCS78603.1 dephospho-CoA kinase [Patescibacteria group bacterium]